MVVNAPGRLVIETGLLLIAHGSPNPEWNQPVLQLGQRVADVLRKKGKYKAVRTGMLEAAKPDVPTTIAELETEGCDRVVAIPLFVAPTGHTHFDVPAVLGIYSSAKTTVTLTEEGARPARPRVPILLTETLADSDVLCQYAADEVRKLSKAPREEAIVFLVHGDPEHALLIERLMRRVVTHCCGEASIGYGDWASVGMGQEYAKGLAAIREAGEHKKNVLVVGLYLSTTAAKIHQRVAKATAHGGHGTAALDPKANVTFSKQPIIEHPSLFNWILETAQGELQDGKKS